MFPEVEVPGLEEFKAACELRGVPGWYADREHGWRSERPGERWPHGANWQTAVTSTLNRWRSDGSPMQPGWKNGSSKNGTSTWELKQRIDQLQKQESQHPANETSSSYTGDPTDEEIANLEKLRTDLKQAEKMMAGRHD